MPARRAGRVAPILLSGSLDEHFEVGLSFLLDGIGSKAASERYPAATED